MTISEQVSFAEAPFEIIDGDRGKNYPKQEDFSEAGHCLFLSATNVTKSGFDFGSCQFIDEKRDALLNKGKLQREDIVLTTRGTIGNTAYFNDAVPFDHLRINSGMVILRCDRTKLIPAFLYHFVRSPSFFSQVNGLRSGVAQPQLPIRDMRQINLPLPPLPIQRRIAGILSAYDELIENSQRRIKILESMARALYREWFVHFRFPGYENVPLVPSSIGQIPQGWEVRPFSALASYVNGYPFKPAQLGTEGKPIIKIKELKGGIIADTPRNPGDGIPEKYNIYDGDVLFSWSADLDTYLWMGGEGLLNQHLFTVLPADDLSRAYCFHALKEAMPRFRALSLGATMHHIKRSALDQVFTVVGPATTRKRFESLVEPMHDQLITLTRQVTNLRRTRDLLLPRLLSGQLDVESLDRA